MLRRIGYTEKRILAVQNNLANTYQQLGRLEEALRLRQEVYSGYSNICDENDNTRSLTVRAGNNLVSSLIGLNRYTEAKALAHKTLSMARRVFGEHDLITLNMSLNYTMALYADPGATLGDLREAVSTLEGMEPTALRVFGSSHPMTTGVEDELRRARAALRARETPSPPPSGSV